MEREQNTLFRVGGAAILLSNKWTDAGRSKFKLLYTVRTQVQFGWIVSFFCDMVWHAVGEQGERSAQTWVMYTDDEKGGWLISAASQIGSRKNMIKT